MGFLYVQAGTSLQKINAAGTTITNLSLPSGVSLSSTRVPRFATLGRYVVLVNSPNVNLLIDPTDDTVRPMSLAAPASAATIAAGTGTGLTGAFKVKYTHGVKNSTGLLVSESPFSPESASFTASNTGLLVTGIAISPSASVNVRRVYRTLSGGAVYFHWADLDGNVQTSIDSNTSDASLSLLPAPSALGNPPGSTAGSSPLELITAWKGRLWARAGTTATNTNTTIVDTLLWSETRQPYAWPAKNSLPVPPVGADEFGVTALIPRRDVLGLAKRDSLWIVTDPNPLEGDLRSVVSGVGCIAPDSVVVIRDTAYWLGEDGVYQWDNNGVMNISEAQVDPWFTSTTYFNQAQFENARGRWNPITGTYDLLLANAGSSDLDRWVSYYLKEKVWLGIHKFDAATTVSIGLSEDTDDLHLPLFGSTSGFLWKEQATRTDDTATAIDADLDTPFYSGNTPDIQKVWLQPSFLSRVETGGTLTITPKTGGLNASAGANKSHNLTLGREKLGRLGVGRLAQLRIRENTAGQDATLYGIEIPYEELGRR